MANYSNLKKADLIDYLVLNKFPLANPLTSLADDEIRRYQESLTLLSEPELQDLYQKEKSQKDSEDDKKRFFNQRNADADFDYWSKMTEWSVDEAVFLSFGKNPEIVTWLRMKEILSHTSPFVKECMQLKELVERARKAKHFTDTQIPMASDPIRPHKFVDWMHKNNLKFPEPLAEKVVQTYHINKPPKSDTEKLIEDMTKSVRRDPIEIGKKQIAIAIARQIKNKKLNIPKPLHTKEKETLLKMVAGMAVDAYRYDPSAARSPIPKEIADALAELGISLDTDTVRKWLKESTELLPRATEDSTE